VSVLNAKFRQCLSDCKQLNTPGLLQKAGVDPGSTNITADRILYNHAIQMVRNVEACSTKNCYMWKMIDDFRMQMSITVQADGEPVCVKNPGCMMC
jgi:hypothetical protein